MIRILAMVLVVVMMSQGVAVSRIVESGTVNNAGSMREWQWEYEQTRAARQEVCGVASKEDVGVEGKKAEDEGVGVMEEVKEGLVKFTEWFVLSIVVPVGITVLTQLLVAGAR